MKNLIDAFPKQLKESLSIAKLATLKPVEKHIKNVVITGLGGSGIGGKIVADLLCETCSVSISLNNGYTLPGFVNEETLVIVSSYSGNTEETLSAMHIALERNAEVACITSGGKIAELAKSLNLNHIIVPGGNPPRACLGYSLVQQFRLLEHYNLHVLDYHSAISNMVALIEAEIDDIKAIGKALAGVLQQKIGVIYAESQYEGIVTRIRQQINENAKQLCWHHVVPEMNHNELVGWGGGDNRFTVILLRSPFDHPRSAKRMDLVEEIVGKKTQITTVQTKGENPLEATIYLNAIGDWTSWYLSELNQVDAIEIDVIDYLKSELSKF